MLDPETVAKKCRAVINGACMEQAGDNEDMPESEFRMNSFCWGGPTTHLRCPYSQYCKESDCYRPDLMK